MRTGLVVGASGGIGAACARLLAASVDRVVLVGTRAPRLDSVAREIGAEGVPIVADIASSEDRNAIVTAAKPDGSELAWVVLASGVPFRGPLDVADPAMITRTLEVDLLGPILLLRALAGVRWSDPAAAVVVGSISASRALPERAVYSAAKAGLERFCASLAAEWQPRGIRVNVVAPGVVDTPFVGADREALKRWSRERVPAGRPGAAEEVAELVRYLVLEAPGFIVGSRFVIDGGSEAIA